MVATTAFYRSDNPPRPAGDRATRVTASRQEALRDAELVVRFNGGDERAFVEIITLYRGKMFSVALSVLRNRSDAEEIAQDTFIRAHRGLAQFRGDSALATWLHGIALNLSRNRYWYNLHRHQHTTLSFDSRYRDNDNTNLASLIASNDPGPVQEVETSEFSEFVAECMERLGPGQREILTRRSNLNCTYDEIALTFGISIGTVKSRIARARESLRGLLAKACPDFAPDVSLRRWFDPARTSGRPEIADA